MLSNSMFGCSSLKTLLGMENSILLVLKTRLVLQHYVVVRPRFVHVCNNKHTITSTVLNPREPLRACWLASFCRCCINFSLAVRYSMANELTVRQNDCTLS